MPSGVLMVAHNGGGMVSKGLRAIPYQVIQKLKRAECLKLPLHPPLAICDVVGSLVLNKNHNHNTFDLQTNICFSELSSNTSFSKPPNLCIMSKPLPSRYESNS